MFPHLPIPLCLLMQSLSQAGLSSDREIVCRGIVTVPVSAVTPLADLFQVFSYPFWQIW